MNKKSNGEIPVRHLLRRLRRDERGATSIEYGLIVAVVGIGLVVTLKTFPSTLNAIFGEIAASLK